MEQADKKVIDALYEQFGQRVNDARQKMGRPLTYAEKVLFAHLAEFPSGAQPVRGKSFLYFKPDRVAMQDATAQMAILQFMVTARDTVAVPSTVHCDHLILAHSGSKSDLLRAIDENREVYEFLRSASARYGIGFWQPGSGIIHQVVLEQYAFPGGMMIGTDSHTPNAGGLGMVAIGVGGADAVDVMAGQPWGLVYPRVVGVHLKGKLSGWTSPKDVILKVAGALTVAGGTGKIIEYFGPGASSISCTGKATITNMGAELGATTSIFPYDARMSAYLRHTKRAEIAEVADKLKEHLCADPEVLAEPGKYYDEILEIDLSTLEPSWVGPHTPDLLRSVSQMREEVQKEQYPDEIRVALIGSCTNSSYEDISRAASIARQARARGLKTKCPLLVTPGSDQIHKTVTRDGFMSEFESVGATVLANACGPCIGQWQRDDIKKGERNTIVTSYNRNFRKRNDDNPETLAFIGSPEMVTAAAFAGRLSFDPRTDTLIDAEGKEFMFEEPSGDELPQRGYEFSQEGYLAAPQAESERKKLTVVVDSNSDRLSLLEPFPAWDGEDFTDLLVLAKAKGKCTTDHISQAGPWLKYRGHLANISNNMLLGAVNAFTGEAGKGTNVLTNEKSVVFPEIANHYKAQGRGWVIIGDTNYGEGSSREHAAMSPRFLGCKAVIVRSFARIHETNLKAQGILPLTFVDPAAYDAIGEYDHIDIVGLKDIAPGSKVTVRVHSNGAVKEFEATHTFTNEQLKWFKAGSALNTLRPAS